MPPADIEHEHKQVPILDSEGETVFEVDEGIQGLIQYLYDRGIKTYNSCQDNSWEAVWVEYSLEAWMGLASRVFHGKSYELREFIEEACEVKLHFQDDGFPDENDEFWIEGGSLIWTASVRFPKEFLKDFEQMLQGILGAA